MCSAAACTADMTCMYRRVQVPAGVARLPADHLSTKTRRIAVCDFLTRRFGEVVSASGEVQAL